MLKWAVNGPRQTCLQDENNQLGLTITAPLSPSEQQRRHLKRKSSNLDAHQTKTSWHDKENQYTSTPLQTSSRSIFESPSRKIDCLKDLSNIVHEISYNCPLAQSSRPNIVNILKTPETIPISKNVPNNYASTLPTFDVEYSPCALIPGPLLALRGVAIPDSYFEKPRYITPNSKEDLNTPQKTKSSRNPTVNTLKLPTCIEESTLSSTKMGDATLERMIDAILESNRKEIKPSKSQKPAQQQPNMSPTYTPAEDPASDLQEIWDSDKSRYRQREHKFKTRLAKKSLFNENVICSPLLQGTTLDAGQLKRQKAMRRKRKITQITATVMNSAQKLLSKTPLVLKPIPHSQNQRNIFEAELVCEEIHSQKRNRNLSPDSGHNSSSDYEEDKNDSTLESIADNTKILDITKRRLSLSLQNLE